MEHPKGTTVLVLGILSLTILQILGPFAWVMGNRAKADVDADPGRYTNAGLISAGRICGMVATILLVLAVVVGGLALLMVVAARS